MRARRVIRIVVVCYGLFCAILAIVLGELAFRPQRLPVQSASPPKPLPPDSARFYETFRSPPATVAICRAGSRVQ